MLQRSLPCSRHTSRHLSNDHTTRSGSSGMCFQIPPRQVNEFVEFQTRRVPEKDFRSPPRPPLEASIVCSRLQREEGRRHSGFGDRFNDTGGTSELCRGKRTLMFPKCSCIGNMRRTDSSTTPTQNISQQSNRDKKSYRIMPRVWRDRRRLPRFMPASFLSNLPARQRQRSLKKFSMSWHNSSSLARHNCSTSSGAGCKWQPDDKVGLWTAGLRHETCAGC